MESQFSGTENKKIEISELPIVVNLINRELGWAIKLPLIALHIFTVFSSAFI